MKTALCVLSALVVIFLSHSATARLTSGGNDAMIQSAFLKWTEKYQKIYTTPEEAAKRLQIFKHNFYRIKDIMDNIPKNGLKLAINKFADLSPEEFKAQYLTGAHTKRKPSDKSKEFFINTTLKDVPMFWDWRFNDPVAVTDVVNQGSCGSSYPFAAVGALEGINVIHRNASLTKLSIQQIVDCSWDFGNQGCYSGDVADSFDYTTKFGIETAQNYPFSGNASQCKYNASNVLFKTSGYKVVPYGSQIQLMAAVAGQPVAAMVEADSTVFQFYKSGVIGDDSCGQNVNHNILVVGYADRCQENSAYWIAKNSWGADWGEDGFFRVKKDDSGAGTCGIAEYGVYPTL